MLPLPSDPQVCVALSPWFARSVGAILAWIQPNQHFGLSPAVTEPMAEHARASPVSGVCMPLLAIHLWLSWVMGRPAAALAEIPSPS